MALDDKWEFAYRPQKAASAYKVHFFVHVFPLRSSKCLLKDFLNGRKTNAFTREEEAVPMKKILTMRWCTLSCRYTLPS